MSIESLIQISSPPNMSMRHGWQIRNMFNRIRLHDHNSSHAFLPEKRNDVFKLVSATTSNMWYWYSTTRYGTHIMYNRHIMQDCFLIFFYIRAFYASNFDIYCSRFNVTERSSPQPIRSHSVASKHSPQNPVLLKVGSATLVYVGR